MVVPYVKQEFISTYLDRSSSELFKGIEFDELLTLDDVGCDRHDVMVSIPFIPSLTNQRSSQP
jgi:hypothetical protein